MVHLLFTLLTSFLIVLLATPALIKVAFLKRLFDEPGDARKLHKRVVPTIGGIIIFAATLFAFSLWFPYDHPETELLKRWIRDFQFIVACMLILFFVGVKDDIIGTAPMKKLAAHIIVGMILVLMGEVRIHSLHGLFGVTEIPLWASIFLSLFTYIVVVNAFNLIDGVDGLAAGVGLIGGLAYGAAFGLGGDIVMGSLGFALAGSLAAFLVFNFSPAKIFMGDSGAMSIGLVLAVLAIKYVEFIPDNTVHPFIHEIFSPVMAMAIIAYALTDTLRIFLWRAIRGVSPFSADRNHMHHLLIDSGMSHAKTVLCIYAASFSVIGVAVLTRLMPVTISFCITGGYVIVISFIPWIRKRMHMKKKGMTGETRHLDSVSAA
ncbi:MAG: undecaprenyl/decaprenyl-phosphate alpha-N-acetylglucosaminyl 1-phosphate transferase [Bacteroidetes bacterium]|nr:undecaprenyl/decaprenyl-phosphate alpha-N-acetylglucosaminyl 1-phosphate transferase [Bacteroidota bacterium]